MGEMTTVNELRHGDPQSNANALLTCIDRLEVVEGIDSGACRVLREKLSSQQFNLLVMGQFKRGKSTLINALLGANLLPVGVVPLTSIATIIAYGEKVAVSVVYENGREEEILAEQIADYVTERGNPHNIKEVKEVLIDYPSSYLRDGVRLIDTPGGGSVYQHNTDLSYRYLPQADAVLFLLSADQPVSQAECEFLRDVQEYAGKMFFLLNKADYLNEHDLPEAVAFTRRVIAEVMEAEPTLFPVSALLALEGSLTGSPKALKMSRFGALAEALENFLARDKRRVLLDSVSRSLLRLIAQARLTVELERSSLRTPLDELQVKLAAFQNKKQEVLLAHREFGIILESEAKRLMQETVEPDLADFASGLARQVLASVEEGFRQSGIHSTRDLHEALRQRVIGEITGACNGWRHKEDQKMAELFTSTCTRFTARLDEVVDELFHFTAELFAIPYDSIRVDSPANLTPDFSYKFWSEPGGMNLFTSSLILRLPRSIGGRIVLERMRKYGSDTVEMHSGRLHHDFAVRLDKSMRMFRRELLEKLEATVTAIEAALTKGGTLARSRGEASEQRDRDLAQAGKRLDEIKASIATQPFRM